MPNLDEIQYRLRQLASPAPWKDGFHMGMRENSNAIEMEIGMMLSGGMQESRPENVVELGTGPGYSTCWLLIGLEKIQQGHVWTVDVVPADEPLWIKYGLPAERVTYLSNETIQSAVQGNLLPERIDFMFHDAGHHGSQVIEDIELLVSRIPDGGTIAVHDVNYMRGMGDLVRDWFDARQDEWKYEEINMACGIGIARRIRGGYTKPVEERKLVEDVEKAGAPAAGGAGPAKQVSRRSHRVANRAPAGAGSVRRKAAPKRARRPALD